MLFNSDEVNVIIIIIEGRRDCRGGVVQNVSRNTIWAMQWQFSF